MHINMKIRIKSIKFWLAIVPASLLLIQVIAVPFGYNFDIEPLNTQLTAIINAVFAVLTICGVVTDPTTQTLSDSDQALEYKKMKEAHK